MRHLVSLLLLPIAFSLSCMSSTTSVRKTIEFDQPRVSAGVIAPEASRELFSEAIAALEESANRRRPEPRPDDSPRTATTVAPQHLPLKVAIDADFPVGAGRLIPLAKLSTTELDELVDSLLLKFTTENGYGTTASAIVEMLPPLPEGIARGNVLARSTDDGLRLLRIGYRCYMSQPDQLWVYGVEMRSKSIVPNDDVALVGPAALATLESIQAGHDTLSLL